MIDAKENEAGKNRTEVDTGVGGMKALANETLVKLEQVECPAKDGDIYDLRLEVQSMFAMHTALTLYGPIHLGFSHRQIS